MATDNPLSTAVTTLRQRGFEVVGPIHDPNGVVGFGMHHNGRNYLVVAKEYSYRGRASCMKWLAEKAHKRGLWLVFYQADVGEFIVFEPEVFMRYSRPSGTEWSKKAIAEWRDIPKSYGVPLAAHLEGRRWSPRAAAADEQQSSLAAFSSDNGTTDA